MRAAFFRRLCLQPTPTTNLPLTLASQDTHVYQIAIRDYAFPGSKVTAVTPQINTRVADKLRAIWGAHAGWCQQVLFFADLKPIAVAGEPRKRKAAVAKVERAGEDEDGKPVVRRLTFEEEVQALIEQPGKRRRVGVKVEVEVKAEEKIAVKREGGKGKSRGRKRVVKEEEVQVEAMAKVEAEVEAGLIKVEE